MLLIAQSSFDLTPVLYYAAMLTYLGLTFVAIWGVYCVILLMRRISGLQFESEEEQDDFLEQANVHCQSKDYEELESLCEDDSRAVVQLMLLAVRNRRLPDEKIRELLLHRYQRDVTAELEYRTTWVQTIIKAAPMLGLFGTVIGMMGAFSKLGSVAQVSADALATDIMFALVTTALGLAIAIPLILATAITNVRIAKLEDLVAAAVTRILDIVKP